MRKLTEEQASIGAVPPGCAVNSPSVSALSVTEDAELPIKPLNVSGPAVEYDKLRSALLEIAEIADTSEFPDRHGIKHQACDTTCLNECGIVAKKALGIWKSTSVGAISDRDVAALGHLANQINAKSL